MGDSVPKIRDGLELDPEDGEEARRVRRIVAKMLGVEPDGHDIGMCFATGNTSKKMLGEMVAQVGEQCRYVVVDLRGVTRISGKRPWWR